MPQLDPTWFLTQVFWLAIAFVVLYVVLARAALPRLTSLIEEREARIAGDVARAEALKAEAEGVLAAYEKMMSEARAKAEATIREAGERLTREAEAQNAALGQKLAAEAAAAESRIAAARREALSGLRTVATEAAQAAVGRLSGLSVGADEAGAAVAAVAPRFEERG